MRNPMRSLTLALAGLLCLAPLAAAQTAPTGSLGGSGAVSADDLAGAYGVDASEEGAKASAQAAADEAAGRLQVEAEHADATRDEGFWAWIGVSLGALVERLADLLGADRAAVDGTVDLKAGTEGVSLDAVVEDVHLGATGSGPDETRVDDGMAKVHETKGTVEGMLPSTG